MEMKGMDMKGMMKDHNDKMSSMKMTSNADVDFAMMMRVHHQGAIDVAEAELRDGKDPQMKKMAKGIIERHPLLCLPRAGRNARADCHKCRGCLQRIS